MYQKWRPATDVSRTRSTTRSHATNQPTQPKRTLLVDTNHTGRWREGRSRDARTTRRQNKKKRRRKERERRKKKKQVLGFCMESNNLLCCACVYVAWQPAATTSGSSSSAPLSSSFPDRFNVGWMCSSSTANWQNLPRQAWLADWPAASVMSDSSGKGNELENSLKRGQSWSGRRWTPFRHVHLQHQQTFSRSFVISSLFLRLNVLLSLSPFLSKTGIHEEDRDNTAFAVINQQSSISTICIWCLLLSGHWGSLFEDYENIAELFGNNWSFNTRIGLNVLLHSPSCAKQVYPRKVLEPRSHKPTRLHIKKFAYGAIVVKILVFTFWRLKILPKSLETMKQIRKVWSF